MVSVKCAVSAMRVGRTDILCWWRTQYLPNGPDTAEIILRNAAYMSHLHVIQWLFEVDEYTRPIPEMEEPLLCARSEIVCWMHEHQPHVKVDVWLKEVADLGDLHFIKWIEGQVILS